MGARDKINFVPHVRAKCDDSALRSTRIANLIYKSDRKEAQWIVETTGRIGDWRSKSRSTYIRWALAINGLLLAEREYGKWEEHRQFEVKTLRIRDGKVMQVPMARWDGRQASENHAETSRSISSYGVCDLYGCLEEIIFEAYRIYLNHNQGVLLRGAEFNDLKRLFDIAKREPTFEKEWQLRWKERIEAWQRKKAYEGIGSVFLAYCRGARIKKPSGYKLSTPETWARSISGIAELRNLLTHGQSTVSKTLGEFSRPPSNLGFDFKEGELIDVKLNHMMCVECFIDQLLTAINLSLIEIAEGPQKDTKASG